MRSKKSSYKISAHFVEKWLAGVGAVIEFNSFQFINPAKSGDRNKIRSISISKSAYNISAHLAEKWLSYEL